MKLLFIGGHITPALAVMEQAKQHKDEIIFVGRTYTNHARSMSSQEKSLSSALGAKFIPYNATKINRHQKLKSLFTLPQIFSSISTAKKILKKVKPDVVISFGGYLAVPIALAAKKMSIPVITHEQTTSLGLSNKIISYLADQVALSWADTKHNLSASKVIFTGNPLRSDLRNSAPKPKWLNTSGPILYITGGNQGSAAINQVIIQSIESLTKDYVVVHQTGNQTIPKIENKKYFQVPWLTSTEVTWMLSNSRIVISRSGANTVTEIAHKQIPAILIPLPHSANNEQYTNAKMLESTKSALIINQNQFSPETLLSAINRIEDNYDKYKKNCSKNKSILYPHPEKTLYQAIKSVYEGKKKSSH